MSDELDGAMGEAARKFRLGATGAYPQGKLGPADEGELRVALTVAAGKLVINFGKSLSWLAMTPGQAREFGRLLIARADRAEAGEGTP